MSNPEKRFTNPDLESHHELALWAADCAEHVLPLFEKVHPDDERPSLAIVTLRDWTRGEKTMVACREAAFAAHTAARTAEEPSAIAAARASGQAAAVAHMYTHAFHAAEYAAKAVSLSVPSGQSQVARNHEIEWQRDRLRRGLWSLVWPES